MILLKIGGSLIVTKNTQEEINQGYLQDVHNFLETFGHETIIITHGTGNVGHGFVQQFGLTSTNRTQLRDKLDEYFSKIDQRFPGFRRIRAEDIVTGKYSIREGEKIICGGDITALPSIISSDDVFAYVMHHHHIRDSYMLTDVDGVFDANKHIIKEIDKDTLKNIHFRNKEGDVTGAMQQKIEKLFYLASDGIKTVRIINGKHLDNFGDIIQNKTGIGTKVQV